MTASNTTNTNTTDTTNNTTTDSDGERHNHIGGDDYSCAYVWLANFIYKMTLTNEGTVTYEQIWQAKPHLNFSNTENFDGNDYR